CGAIATSLSSMVAALTLGKKGYELQEAEMQEIKQKALKQREPWWLAVQHSAPSTT
ncbi:MAG: cyclodeaminase/cyclohydrolase family protein, partial [Deltaproteobacteria bacterium]|nr:cyclodeaminase/cyclohydrolase family protein [Deltaproteobacteria bacterium]